MKKLSKILLGLLVFIGLLALAGYFYLQTFAPNYEGNLDLEGLEQEVEVYFDEYGIPHIYGANEHDTYYALGYLHAQERLWQMDLMRRAGNGRLSEILGSATLDTDKFFRTLGINQVAKKEAEKHFRTDIPQTFQPATMAYLDGVNAFVATGKGTVEHKLLGAEIEPFTIEDCFSVGGVLALGFAKGFKTEPVVERIRAKLGMDYLNALALETPEESIRIDTYLRKKPTDSVSNQLEKISLAVKNALDKLPIPLWIGSNSWVVAPSRTKNGKVILANDAHMGYSQPAVWYEAHLEYPGFSLYGRHAGAIPFALIGHNRNSAWGLTMFLNDDTDFFREKSNPENPNQIWVDSAWVELEMRKEIIKVKDSSAVEITVRSSKHGPIISDLATHSLNGSEQPIAVDWIYLQEGTMGFQMWYDLAKAKNIDDARKAVSILDNPGLNVMFGDSEGNIAWWASAKLFRRPENVQSKMVLDGANGKDDAKEWLSFDYNPKSENPPSGFVYSANNQPDTMNGFYASGYFLPQDRAKRIKELLSTDEVWDAEKIANMQTDDISILSPKLAKLMLSEVPESVLKANDISARAYVNLNNWEGEHQYRSVAPLVYYKFQYLTLKNMMEDEIGEKLFVDFLATHLMKISWETLIQNDSTLWWDDVNTEKVETRTEILTKSYQQTIEQLSAEFGTDISNWKWENAHKLKHNHVFKSVALLDKFFSVGTFKMLGGNQVINNTGHRLYTNEKGEYEIIFGPSMRTVIDFSDIENSMSVIPTGQSGFPLSKHYDDQAELYNSLQRRKQMMNREEIVRVGRKLVLR
ncbi:MAG: penicillin amidase [Flammeovirgaceae bacterium]|jgi:penicillin amidase